MNKYQEALKLIMHTGDNFPEQKDLYKASRLLEKLVDKATPVKPIDIADIFGDCILSCPNCKGPIVNTLYPKQYPPDYCQFCGQALDWSRNENS